MSEAVADTVQAEGVLGEGQMLDIFTQWAAQDPQLQRLLVNAGAVDDVITRRFTGKGRDDDRVLGQTSPRKTWY